MFNEKPSSLIERGRSVASPYLNRFLQPDSIIPNPANPQAYNRFSYVVGNPISFNDPGGHDADYFCTGSNDYSSRCTGYVEDQAILGSSLGGSDDDDDSDTGGDGNGDSEEINLDEIIGLDNYSPLACGPGLSCDPVFLKCWHYELGYRTSQWFEIPCSDFRSNVYNYDYNGSYVPVIGLGIDVAGMYVDAGAVVTSIFGPPAWAVSAEFELQMSAVEISWNTYLAGSGQYEVVYDQYHTNILDSRAARSNDLAEPIPVAGFTSSFVSAINNTQVIVNGIEGHPAYAITWNGLPPPHP
jgi:RHS repeat-associated protein